MSSDLIHASALAACFLLLFGVAELLYHRFGVQAEITRKLVHAGTGLLSLLFPVLLGDHRLVLLLCASFAGLLVLSIRYRLLQSIHAIDRESVGSLAYPVSVYLCYLAFDHQHQQYMYFYLPILLLALCDPLAALVGKRWPVGKYQVGTAYKTLSGSVVFFLSAFTISWAWLYQSVARLSLVQSSGQALLVAGVSTLAEALSHKGYDNLSIPLSVVATMLAVSHLM